MASIEDRLRRLEESIEEPPDETAEQRRYVMYAVLDEYANLKRSRAVGHMGGGPGKPLRHIEPEDIPGRILGPVYTTGDMVGLTVKRVVEREFSANLEDDEAERLIEAWTDGMRQLFERIGKGDTWDRIET